jgi:UDP-3-O-[3-hydroxymyristoyl] glucosamine N-acyltransferase
MFKLGELAELVGGRLKGNPELKIAGFCSLEEPSPGGIAFLEKGKDASLLSNILLGALITTEALSHFFPDVIIAENPKLAFILVMEKFLAAEAGPPPDGSIHERAVVDPAAQVDPTARISANAVLCPGARVGPRSYIGAGAYIGKNSTVGADCTIHANVSIYRNCTIGNHVEIHAGTVIGGDGFGYVPSREGHRRFPQVGTVVIEDHVDIGSNCCIDRGALDATIIHSGTKIDNLVQVAHGVKVGSHTVIAAQTGISGSTRIGNWCIIGGQAGFQGHITVGDQSIVAAQSGVFSDLEFKSKVSGYPAKPHAQSLKVLALTFKLPELVDKLRSLEIELDMLRGEVNSLRGKRNGGDDDPGGIGPAGLA